MKNVTEKADSVRFKDISEELISIYNTLNSYIIRCCLQEPF